MAIPPSSKASRSLGASVEDMGWTTDSYWKEYLGYHLELDYDPAAGRWSWTVYGDNGETPFISDPEYPTQIGAAIAAQAYVREAVKRRRPPAPVAPEAE